MTDISDFRLMRAIAERAAGIYAKLGQPEPSVLGIIAELDIVHSGIVPLRLHDMLTGADADLLHDVAGIHRHLELGDGGRLDRLGGCFLPRYAAPVRVVCSNSINAEVPR